MSEEGKKNSHGFLKFIIALAIIGACLFGVIKFVQCQETKTVVDGNGTTQGNNDGNTNLFSRSANNGDVVIDSDLDLMSLGGKYTVLPQTDIDNLEITVNYLDKNKNLLTSKTKYLGNVKKGVQVSFSFSITDLGVSVVWNTQYESIAVTGGTVSYFA